MKSEEKKNLLDLADFQNMFYVLLFFSIQFSYCYSFGDLFYLKFLLGSSFLSIFFVLKKMIEIIPRCCVFVSVFNSFFQFVIIVCEHIMMMMMIFVAMVLKAILYKCMNKQL